MTRAHQARRANRAAGSAVAVRKALPAAMVVSTNPLIAPVATEVACIGTPLRDLAPDSRGAPLMLRLNGQWLLRAQWGRPVLPGDVIEWHVIPMGGNGNGSRQVLTIIAALVITYLTAGTGAGSLAGALGGGAAGSAGAAAVAVVATIAATALINALIPIQQPSLGTVQSAGSVYNVSTAANQARLTQPIPVIYGRMRVYPDYAGNPYAEYDDNNDQYFKAVYCVGQGCYNRERLEIDDTWLDHYQDVQYEWLEPGQLPTLADSNVVIAPEVIGQPLKSGRVVGGFNVCKAKLQAADIGVDILFSGLGIADGSGNMTPHSVSVSVQARYVDDFGAPAGNWFTLGNETITAATRTQLRKSFRYTLPQPGRVAVRMVRTSNQTDNINYLEDAQWGGLRAYLGNPAPLSATATHLAVRIRASEQLSGLTQRKISAIVRRKLRTWSVEGGWSCDYADYANYTETRNPFWARLDKLSDPVYGDRMPDSRIDLATHAELAAVADARQDRLDIIFDSRVTSIDADRTMLQVARSVPFQRAGVCTLTRDQLQTLPVTAYTSRDIVPGSMSIGYALATEQTADAVIVEYFDNRAWDWLPIQCNAPGVTDPQNIVVQRLLGISGAKHAEREGLYLAAQNVYRRKFPEFTTEMQGLVPAYGSLALFHPAMPGWGQAGDVAFWDAATLTMGLTEPAVFTAGANHFVSLRRDDNSLTDPIAVTPGPTENDIVLATAPDFTLVLDDGTRERPKFIFGAEGQHRIPVRVLGIMKKGRDSNGATRIGIKTVAEDDRVHGVDNHLLPGPGEIQDPVDSVAAGETEFTTVINLNGRTNGGSSSAVGIKLSGMDPDWTLTLDLPSGELYDGWSAWSSDYSSEIPSPPTAWGNAFRVTNSDGSTASFGTIPLTTTGELARAAFSPVTITGYAEYTFWIEDGDPGNNRGGLSIRVEKT